jgi:hypothetical protein
MPKHAKGREGGTSFPTPPDTHTKTARPESVGPHHRTRDQENPTNPGIKPEEGYAAEIARNREAAQAGPAAGPVAPTPKAAKPEESGTAEEPRKDPGPAPGEQPLSATGGKG